MSHRQRFSLSPAAREKYERQLNFVIEHKPEIPKLVNQVVKEISVSPASVYATLSGNMFNTKIIATLYSITAKHLGIDDLVGDLPGTLGSAVANENDRIILEKLTAARQLRTDLSDLIEVFRLIAYQWETAIIASELADSELAANYRLRQRLYSPDTVTELHSYLTNEAATPPQLLDLLPPSLPDRTTLAATARTAISGTPTPTLDLNTVTEIGAGEYELNGVWYRADGTPLVSPGRDKYPDS